MYGIGITTKDRLNLLKELVDSIHKHTDMSNVLLHIEDDSIDNIGVAKRKNNCLRALRGCEALFLLDDDVKIIKDGWIEFFIESKQQHLLFLNRGLHQKKAIEDNLFNENELKYTVEYYHDCGGVFLFMTKEVIEKVGAFNEKFTPYGFEHCEYSIRILGEQNNYPMLKGTDEYIFAHDYSTYGHKSSITEKEKQICIKNNWTKFFNEPIKKIYIPL